jgi:hypothetical protein
MPQIHMNIMNGLITLRSARKKIRIYKEDLELASGNFEELWKIMIFK